MDRITNKAALEFVLSNCELPQEIHDKLSTMRESLEKKSNSKKPTARQLENEQFKEIVLSLIDSTPRTVTEIQSLDATLAELSNQRLSPIINSLVTDGLAVKTITKGRSYFALAKNEDSKEE